MTAETYINSKLSLKERSIPLLVNSEIIYKLMEEYAAIKVEEESESGRDALLAMANAE